MIRKTPYQKSQDKIIKLWLAEEELRKTCEHPKEYVQSFNKCSEADYYNPPEYWVDHTCHWCGKKWSTKQ